MRQPIVNVLFVAALAALAGCVTKQVIVQAPAAPAAPSTPAWVNQGAGAFKDPGVFYGVGRVSGIRNVALAYQAADDRARAEISQTFSSYMARLGKDYQASTSAGEPGKSTEEQHVEVALKSFSKATLAGTVIIDHYVDPATGMVSALCKLDMAAINKSLEQAKDIPEKLRDVIRTNSEKSHDNLNAEEAKH